jgi:hypothetical protein
MAGEIALRAAYYILTTFDTYGDQRTIAPMPSNEKIKVISNCDR